MTFNPTIHLNAKPNLLISSFAFRVLNHCSILHAKPQPNPTYLFALLTLHVLSLSYELRPCILSVCVCSISSPVFLSRWLIRITIYIYSTLFFAILATRSNTPFAFRIRIIGLDPLNSVTQTRRDDFEKSISPYPRPLSFRSNSSINDAYQSRYTLLTLSFVTIISALQLNSSRGTDWGLNVRLLAPLSLSCWLTYFEQALCIRFHGRRYAVVYFVLIHLSVVILNLLRRDVT